MTKSCDTTLRPQLHELWRQGTLVASIAYVLARETRAANPDEALVAAGVGPDLVRVSVGIEDVDDILWDFDQALAAVAGAVEVEP